MPSARIAPRHGFLPPRMLAVPAADPAELVRCGQAAILVDPLGERISSRATIALGWEAGRLHLRARVRERSPVIAHDRGPDHPRFWQQDHIELRLLPDPEQDLDQVQVLMAASGKVLVAGGPAACRPLVSVECDPDGWSLEASLPVAMIGRDALAIDDEIAALVAHVRWGDGRADIVASSPAVLGFNHAERFGRIRCASALPVRMTGVRAEGDGALVIGANHLVASLDGQGRGRLEVREGSRIVARSEGPAAGDHHLPIDLGRPAYRRLEWLWIGADGSRCELGSCTLRAGVAQVMPAVRLEHPYLDGDAGEWARRRALLEQDPYRELHEQMPDLDPLAAVSALSDPEAPDAFRFTPRCGGWFRICRESLLRNGEGGRNPVCIRIWSLLDESARDACRAVVADPDLNDAVLKPLLAAFDRLLDRGDLWDPVAFDRVHLPRWVREQVQRHDGPPPPGRERQRFNRCLLQNAIECLNAYGMDLLGRAMDFAEGWILEPEPHLLVAATEHLRLAETCVILPTHLHLDGGMLCSRFARAWDVCHGVLDDGQRAIWLAWARRLLDFYLDTARAGSWTVTTIANANPVGNGGAGRLALALLAECPDAAQEALRHARTWIWTWLDYCHGVDGGNTEGMQYWQYGMEHFLSFALALERVAGDAGGMLDQPAVTRCMAMVRVGLCNDGATHGVNDTIPVPVGGPIGWFAGSRFDDPLGRWYGDHALRWYRRRQAAGRPVPYRATLFQALCTRPPGPEVVAAPAFPRLEVLDQIAVATLRSQPRWDCEWVAGLKGSRPPYTHHNQDDTASIFVHRLGERLLIDPGYYKGDADCHSVPWIGERGPRVDGAGVGVICDHGTDGELRWVTVDATAAYAGLVRRFRRSLIMLGAEGVAVVDDIVPFQEETRVRSRFQCGGPTVLIHDGIRVLGRETSLALVAASHPGITIGLDAERRLDDVHWGYRFADCRWFPAELEYRAEAQRPLLLLVADPVTLFGVRCQRYQGGEMELAFASGRRVVLTPAVGGWICRELAAANP